NVRNFQFVCHGASDAAGQPIAPGVEGRASHQYIGLMLLQGQAKGWLRLGGAGGDEVVAANDRGHDLRRADPLLFERPPGSDGAEAYLDRRICPVLTANATEELVQVVDDPHRLRRHCFTSRFTTWATCIGAI